MKKILYSIFVVVLSFVLVACAPSDEEKLQEYLGKITVQEEALENFYLPYSIDSLTDHSISWESSNSDVIKIGNLANIDGVNYYTANVKRAEEDVEVELTAIVELASGLSSQKSFRVKVIKAEKEEVNYITVAEALSNKLNAIVVVKGIVSGFHYGTFQEQPSIQGCYLTDETGTIYVYGYILAQTLEKGDEVIVEAKVAEYKTYKQLSEPSLVEAVSKGNNIPTAGAKTDKTIAQIAADLTSDYTGAAYVFAGVQIKKIQGSDYVSYALEDKDGNSINLYSSGDSSEFAWLDQYAGKELKVLFAINSQNSKGTKWRGHVLDVLEVIGDWSGSNNNPGGGNNNPGTTDAKVATISEILSLAASLEDKAKLDGKYQTTGTVTKIDTAYDSSYKNISFTISDGTNEILCYRTYGDLAASVAVGDTVTVVGEVQNYSGTIEFVYADVTARTAGQGGGTENPGSGDVDLGDATAIILFDDKANRTEYSTSKQVWKQNGITVTNNKAASTSNVGDYTNPGRFYKSSDLTIEYSSAITKIVINTPGGKYIFSSSVEIDGATLEINGNTMIIVLDTPATSFTISGLANQIRASQISIYTE